jgi:hypothetical protein
MTKRLALVAMLCLLPLVWLVGKYADEYFSGDYVKRVSEEAELPDLETAGYGCVSERKI